MKVKDIIEIRIEDVLDDGRAFGRYEGFAVFVSGGCSADDGTRYAGAVPGDSVSVEITKVKKSLAEASLREIAEASGDRVTAECPYFGECGGCTMQELSYEVQLRLKRKQVKSKLERLGGLENPRVNETLSAENLKYYRNKATFAVGPHGEVGFKKAKSNYVIDIDDCILQSDAAMVCADALREFLRRHKGEAGTEADGRSGGGRRKKTGAAKTPLGIKEMMVRTAFSTGEVMVALEADTKDIANPEELIYMLDDAVSSINGDAYEETGEGAVGHGTQYSLESVALIYGADTKKGRFGKCEIIAGKPTITEEFIMSDGNIVKYEISPQSFFQVNPEQMVKLYDKVSEYADLRTYQRTECADRCTDKSAADASAGERDGAAVLDLYCGAGTIGIWLLKDLQGSLSEGNSADTIKINGAENLSAEQSILQKTKVIGIESVKPAVLDANRNSVINGLVNTRYICGRAEEELPGMMGLSKLYKWNEVNERVEREPEIQIDISIGNDINNEITAANESLILNHVDVAILDPPRAGCGETLLDVVATASPDRIVYVSCDPGTLARDIKYLSANGYQFIEATPVDMFPWTSSIETVCLLSNTQRPKKET